MVERVARFWRLIEDGHHGLETGLRNESGKVVIQERVGESNPTISLIFTSRKIHAPLWKPIKIYKGDINMKKFARWMTNPITYIVGAVMCIVGVIVWVVSKK